MHNFHDATSNFFHFINNNDKVVSILTSKFIYQMQKNTINFKDVHLRTKIFIKIRYVPLKFVEKINKIYHQFIQQHRNLQETIPKKQI